MDTNKINHTELLARMNKLMDSGLSELNVYIIKSHLVVESEMIKFVEYMTGGKVKGVSFDVLLKIVDEMFNGFNVEKYDYGSFMRKELIKFIRVLTELRNQIAHTLSYDPKTMKEALALCNISQISNEQIKEPFVGMFNDDILLVAIALIEKTGREVGYTLNENDETKNPAD